MENTLYYGLQLYILIQFTVICYNIVYFRLSEMVVFHSYLYVHTRVVAACM